MNRKFGSVLIGAMIAVLAAGLSYGAAATAPVNTPSRDGKSVSLGVYTNTVIYAGTIVALNSAGYAVPAADASGYIVIGRATRTVDNRTGQTGAGTSGTLKIVVERGVFGLNGWTAMTNITATSIGTLAYVLDDNSVTNGTGTYSIVVGPIVDVSGGFIWVDASRHGL